MKTWSPVFSASPECPDPGGWAWWRNRWTTAEGEASWPQPEDRRWKPGQDLETNSTTVSHYHLPHHELWGYYRTVNETRGWGQNKCYCKTKQRAKGSCIEIYNDAENIYSRPSLSLIRSSWRWQQRPEEKKTKTPDISVKEWTLFSCRSEAALTSSVSHK